jgi:ParB family chromosome partitioning protein
MPSIRDRLNQKQSKLNLDKKQSSTLPDDLDVQYQDGGFYNVPLSAISPDPNQPRKYFDPEALDDLALSIKQTGVLQPVIIRMDSDNKIYLVAGERRYRAAKIAKITEIPAILTKGNPMEIALIENLQRDDLKPVEEAEALGRMINEYHYTHDQLAQAIGKARSTITETLSLNRLPEEIKEECRQTNHYPRRLLVEISKQETPEAMKTLFKRIKKYDLKSAQVRDITRKNTSKSQRTLITIAIEKSLNLKKHLQKIDLSNVQEDEKLQLINALQKLQDSMIDILS